jgi:hypothetical protein
MTALQLVAGSARPGQGVGTYTFIDRGALDQRTVDRVVNLAVRISGESELAVKAAVLWAHEIVVYRDAEGGICGAHGFRYVDVTVTGAEYRLAYSPFSVVDDRFADPATHLSEIGALLNTKLLACGRAGIWATVANHGRRHVAPGGFGASRCLAPSMNSPVPSSLRFYANVSDGSDHLPPSVEAVFETLLQEQQASIKVAKARGLLLRPWRNVGGAAAALAVAGAFVLMARPDHESGEITAAQAATRTKGIAALHVYRQTAAGSEETVSSGHFSEGDKLRFGVDLAEARKISIVGVQSNGLLYEAWPPPGSTIANSVGAGVGQILDGAVSLDGATGLETLYLISCAGDAAPLKCESRGATLPPACPPGCVASPFVLDKRGP